jgi:hypothetical protein
MPADDGRANRPGSFAVMKPCLDYLDEEPDRVKRG